ncbi:MAG: CBS domain-containing protein [Gemmatimonadetes bacterium]|nr:CBS domain-containing protein [Gemmatimonadota bacterium]
MILADSLTPESILIDPEGESLEEVLHALLDAMLTPAVEPETRAKRARDIAFGSQGEVVRLHDDVVLVLEVQEGVTRPRAGLVVRREAFAVTAEGRDEVRGARAVLLFLLPGRLSAFRGHAVPTIGRWVKEGDHAARLVAASSPDDVLELPGLAALPLTDRLRVDAVMSPATYRVYPDTPAGEVLDLMVRRGLPAVPVVGEGYEVLGMISAGDALTHLLPSRRTSDPGEPPSEAEGRSARDIMTRSVLCVAEDQALTDAAAMMVNRGVEDLPVVREGELVGILSRDAVLRALHGP